MKNMLKAIGIMVMSIFSSTVYSGVVADTLYLEARGEGEEGMRAVATVIYNRAKGDRSKFIDTCLKPKQFSCWNAPRTRAVAPTSPLDAEAYNTCLEIEKELLTGKFEPLGIWNHYYNYNKCRPCWADSLKFKQTIGNHLFGRL